MAVSSHAAENATKFREDEVDSMQQKITPTAGDGVIENHATNRSTEMNGRSSPSASTNEFERKAYIIGICGGSASGKTTGKLICV